MSDGVRYDIQANTGDSDSRLGKLIELMQQSVNKTTDLGNTLGSLKDTASSAMDGIKAAVEGVSNAFSSKLTPAVEATGQNMDAASEKTNSFGDKLENLGRRLFFISQIQQGVAAIKDVMDKMLQPGVDLDNQLKQIQPTSSLTDDQLKQLSDSARDNARAFGIEAADGAKAYGVYLSAFGDNAAKVPGVIEEMGKDAAIVSKQMGGDVSGAATMLSSAVQQFAGNLTEPAQKAQGMTAIMNVMSAAAQNGSAKLPDLSAALSSGGDAAKDANISFTETAAVMEILADNGKKGADGGTALKSILDGLSNEKMSDDLKNSLEAAGVNVDALSDKSLSLSDRLDVLKPVASDAGVMAAMFGDDNAGAAIGVITHADNLSELTDKISGTHAAMDAANTVMDSASEKQNKIVAAVKDWGISIQQATGPFMPFISIATGAIGVISQLGGAMTVMSAIAKSKLWPAIWEGLVSMGSWISSTIMATVAQISLNAAMAISPIGWLAIGIGVAIAVIIILIKYWHQIWDAIVAFGKWIWEHNPFKFLIDVVDNIFPGFKKTMGELWDWVAGKFEALIDWFKKAWDWIKKLFGGASDTSEAAKSAYQQKVTEVPGITAPAATTNAVQDNFKNSSGKTDDKDGKQRSVGSDTAKATSSGGSRPTTINITIQKLQDKIEIITSNIGEGAKEAANTVVNELLMALNSVDNKGGLSYD